MLDLSISKELRLTRFNFNIATSTIAAICLIIMFIVVPTPFAISQVPDTTKYGVKITYPNDGETVSVGELTIFGTARYDATNNACTVYADWNNSQPMQKAMPAGLNFTEFGRNSNDYSSWTFTYTSQYHLISEGTNELTAKLSCDVGPFNSTKYDSVTVTGLPTED
jgi:hypothetical protein